ncbi:MAG: ribonuclease P protein component 4 [Candidatus Hodarchaeota archaeon]
MPSKRFNSGIVKQVAKVRMNYLLTKAHEIFPYNRNLANRYVYLARRYSQRAKIKIPNDWKRRICNKCKRFLYPGLNCRIRLHSLKKATHISMTCFDCNKTTRYYIKTKNI